MKAKSRRQKPSTPSHARGFALGAAFLLLLSTLFFLYVGLGLLQAHVTLSNSSGLPPIPGLNNSTKAINGELFTIGLIGVVLGLVYLAAAILVFSGNRGGLYAGLSLSALTLVAIAFFIHLLPSDFYLGLIIAVAPLLTITFLLMGRRSFGPKPSSIGV